MGKVLTKTVDLGRLPVFCGAYNSTKSYHKYNIVNYYGSSFINLNEGNTVEPCVITVDSSNRLVNYSFEKNGQFTGWMFVANGFDASIYAMNMGDYAKNVVDEVVPEMQNQIYDLMITMDKVSMTFYLGNNASSPTTTAVYKNLITNVFVRTVGTAPSTGFYVGLTYNGQTEWTSKITSYKTGTKDASISNMNVSSNQSFVGSIKHNDSKIMTANFTLYAVDPIFYGYGASFEAYKSSLPTNPSNYPLPIRTTPASSSNTDIYTITIPAAGAGSYLFFLVPTAITTNITRITFADGLGDVPFTSSTQTVNIVTSGNVSYKVYQSRNTYDPGTYKLLINR